MSGQCWAVLGLCWADGGSFGGLYGLPWRFLEGKNNPQRESLCVEGYFGSLVETMSGQCWAVLGLCWAHVGSFDGLFGVPWSFLRAEKNLREACPVEGFLGLFSAPITWAQHRPQIDQHWPDIGPALVNDTQRNDCIIRILMMRSFPWPMLSNVRSMLGPCWGIWWASWGFMEVSWWEKRLTTPNETIAS